jgi:alpha-tubulin suppressor-like RCC1 family protein
LLICTINFIDITLFFCIQVEALLSYRVMDIACGSGDAQTLCITDDDNVWSWGDGDYGKLGRGGSDGCKVSILLFQMIKCRTCTTLVIVTVM